MPVSLLVRLWVEILRTGNGKRRRRVSLLVRLWVEIFLPSTFPQFKHRSASLWGCELKYTKYFGDVVPETVSLLVRLWVEIFRTLNASNSFSSASLWGCELKCYESDGIRSENRQPPCEAVSWNWKDQGTVWRKSGVSLLVRLWVEIKRTVKDRSRSMRQPPCEAVSWNFYVDWPFLHRYRSAFLSVEMPFWLCHNRHDIGQSLWETVNWKEEYGVIVVAARKLTSILLEEDCEMNHSHI